MNNYRALLTGLIYEGTVFSVENLLKPVFFCKKLYKLVIWGSK